MNNRIKGLCKIEQNLNKEITKAQNETQKKMKQEMRLCSLWELPMQRPRTLQTTDIIWRGVACFITFHGCLRQRQILIIHPKLESSLENVFPSTLCVTPYDVRDTIWSSENMNC